jgi:hypothetical protein
MNTSSLVPILRLHKHLTETKKLPGGTGRRCRGRALALLETCKPLAHPASLFELTVRSCSGLGGDAPAWRTGRSCGSGTPDASGAVGDVQVAGAPWVVDRADPGARSGAQLLGTWRRGGHDPCSQRGPVHDRGPVPALLCEMLDVKRWMFFSQCKLDRGPSQS